ncbi:uncharacterized protein K460DRAFT_351311 [Cucurbitaria berberidis CBS 394.84]|uniref:Uncharacterized protein n=1 Tax=Cucurbitaria berberidis CBS 394.84 TaxID=1168544 RepID=A0A9P4GU52_9PLEO|nr:uncharacterized protein K460DRAFT_351311 [Cucurbitaria berberidis CBS 394.84]KAF1851382.1 hypothetical protein K460DRAFT_351311 [Cucurbitaria berberidis CBS 394.84]
MLALPYSRHANIERDEQYRNAFIARHQLFALVLATFSRVFAPMTYLQCASSEPRWKTPSTHEATIDRQYRMIIDDDYALIDDADEQDGGPLCREATIAMWKTNAEPLRKERRRTARVQRERVDASTTEEAARGGESNSRSEVGTVTKGRRRLESLTECSAHYYIGAVISETR